MVIRPNSPEYPSGRAAIAAAKAKAGAKRAAAGKMAAKKAEASKDGRDAPKGRGNPAKATSAHYEAFVSDLVFRHDGIEAGSLFGMPCLKVRGKAFAGSYDGGVAFKLPPARYQAERQLPGVTGFDPSGKGRPMGTWAVLPPQYRGRWRALAEESMAFVSAGG